MNTKLFALAGAWLLAVCLVSNCPAAEEAKPESEAAKPAAALPFEIGQQAPAFKIKDASGQEIDLQKLTAKGPVLVRLTCGCSGCDKELAYFQTLHEAYKDKGLTSLAVFKEPDAKVEEYVKQKKLQMLYAVDSAGSSWATFHTTTMPTNFLIEKGGKIKAIAAGCDPSGLVAKKLAEKVAGLVDNPATATKTPVDPKK